MKHLVLLDWSEMDVGQSIKQLRESHGLTQVELGKIAKVSGYAVSQWENGRAVPRMGAIQRIADYFGVPKSEIMGDRRDNDALTADEWELIDCYRSMTPAERGAFLHMAKVTRNSGSALNSGVSEGAAV